MADNDATRDDPPHRPTQDEQLLETPKQDEFTHTDTWRVFRIMGEFVEGFDELASVTRGVSVFGSARRPRERNTRRPGNGRDSRRAGFAVRPAAARHLEAAMRSV